MSPGYVRTHPRILAARLDRNYWDTSLTATITIVTPRPAPLARSSEWHGPSRWRDWPTQHIGGRTMFVDPSEEDLAKSAYLLATARLAFPVPTTSLPSAPAGPDDNVEDAARAAVRVLTDELDRIVTPVIDVVEAA